MSPSTLPGKYIPRIRKPPAPHPAAAAATAATQATHLQAPNRFETKTESTSTTYRIPSLTRFKPGFEEDTERELSIIFRRPMRTYKEDPPFYPYLPPTPKVCFNLNYKC